MTASFWTATITDVIQAFSSIASVGVAVWATRVALKVKSDGQSIAADLTSVSNAGANTLLPPQAQVTWDVRSGGKYSRLITNTGTTTAGVTAVNDVTPGGSNAFMLIDELPIDVPANAVMVANMSRSIADPLVSRIEIVWTELGIEFRQTYSVV